MTLNLNFSSILIKDTTDLPEFELIGSLIINELNEKKPKHPTEQIKINKYLCKLTIQS